VGLLVLFPPFPVAYLLIGRLFMAKVMFADTRCRGCGRCARDCPNHAIAMLGARPRRPFWTHRCEACLRCVGYCRYHAAGASHLWAALVVYATSLLTAGLAQDALQRLVGARLAWPAAVWQAGAYALVLAALPLLYYAFFGLQQIRPLRTLLTYTTLTRYYRRRYHEPATAVDDLTGRPRRSGDPRVRA
jgi:ferredoxin